MPALPLAAKNFAAVVANQQGVYPDPSLNQVALPATEGVLHLFNESPCGLIITTDHYTTKYFPAGWADTLDILRGEQKVNWVCQYVGQAINNALLTGMFYDKDNPEVKGLYRGPVKPAIQSIPPLAIGPGGIPDSVYLGVAATNGIIPPGVGGGGSIGNDLWGGVDTGIWGDSNAVVGANNKVILEINAYSDSVNDKFVALGSAYQLYIDSLGIIHARMDNGVNHGAANAITWGADIFTININNGLITMNHFASDNVNSIASDGAGGLTAAGYFLGAEATGASWTNNQGGSFELGAGEGVNPGIAQTPFLDFHSSANARDFDSRIIASGGGASDGLGALQLIAAAGLILDKIQKVGSQATAGSFGVPTVPAQTLRQSVTVTTLTTILSFSIPANGTYRITFALDIGNTATSHPHATYSFTDNRGVVQNGSFSSAGSGTFAILNGVVAFGATFGYVTVYSEAAQMNAGTLTIQYQTDGTPNDTITVIVERLA